jgi:hypothetical protein
MGTRPDWTLLRTLSAMHRLRSLAARRERWLAITPAVQVQRASLLVAARVTLDASALSRMGR